MDLGFGPRELGSGFSSCRAGASRRLGFWAEGTLGAAGGMDQAVWVPSYGSSPTLFASPPLSYEVLWLLGVCGGISRFL